MERLYLGFSFEFNAFLTATFLTDSAKWFDESQEAYLIKKELP